MTGDRRGGYSHLTAEQVAAIGRADAEVSATRGRHLARVVVDVYERDEDAQVQVPRESDLDVTDTSRVAALVQRAAEALRSW
ncbi:MAG: hypothetical protein S0880_09715 [Actinomycetota bacterium]|nr:hypothetical protein [Actinomycetota bacterium]